jgi:hypothetical protein
MEIHLYLNTIGISVPKISHHSLKYQILRYHELWDWLMPVVDKIEDIQDGEDGDAIRFHYYDFEIRHITCKIHGTNIEILDADSKIDAVYQAVIQFIEFYNDQK